MLSLSPSERDELLALAGELGDLARSETLAQFRPEGGIGAQNKLASGFDPVTEADRAAEAVMRAHLEERRPQDGIFGEEYGVKHGTSGLTWVLDPIDGTRGFMSGTPTWGVLIALCAQEEDGPGAPLLGVIDQPYIGERFSGGFGAAEVSGPLGHRPLVTRSPRALDEAVLFTTFPEVGTEAEGAAFARLSRQVRLTRYGMDCYAYALVAAGQIDLVVEAGLQPYDVAAPIAVIEAAGGIVTDWQGRPAHRGGRVIAAANPEIHAAALEHLAT
ncbi:MAG: inositol monophosphatase family protein [Thioclava marina]|jgi:histidinol-phosphate phosphatase HisN, inositol monophosphatase family|uniref:3'(2'),5'-bisphosphate nucleotidase n=1 Tax=Thioclava marina TaxID=1915077 RepID=A0ABX3MNS7_9RHOB|nr:inositol monophosphatase family protein [Thioclava marina]MBC7147616.1 inositol monophosphatase family protein [Thioclava marina]OOY12901.1 histidinol-phosphatase [Thioclava marina]